MAVGKLFWQANFNFETELYRWIILLISYDRFYRSTLGLSHVACFLVSYTIGRTDLATSWTEWERVIIDILIMLDILMCRFKECT